MITDRIGRQEVLLPINHNLTKFFTYKALFFKPKHKKFQDSFLLAVKKKAIEARA